jgi:methylmalonyl-CoA mutase
MTFPTPSPADWKTLAEKALKDKPLESLVHMDADSLVVRPLYAGVTEVEAVFAPRPSDAEGRAWDLRTLVEGDDPAASTRRCWPIFRAARPRVVLKGDVLADSEPLGRALDAVALELAAVGLDAGLDGPEAANALAVAAKGSPRARLMFHMDPISAFAQTGAAPRRSTDASGAGGQYGGASCGRLSGRDLLPRLGPGRA